MVKSMSDEKNSLVSGESIEMDQWDQDCCNDLLKVQGESTLHLAVRQNVFGQLLHPFKRIINHLSHCPGKTILRIFQNTLQCFLPGMATFCHDNTKLTEQAPDLVDESRPCLHQGLPSAMDAKDSLLIDAF